MTLPEPDPELQRLAAAMAAADQQTAELAAAETELRRLASRDALHRRRAQQAAEDLTALARRRWIAWLWPFGQREQRVVAAQEVIAEARQVVAELEPEIVSARAREAALREVVAAAAGRRFSFAAALAARADAVRAGGGAAAQRLVASDAMLAKIDTELQQVESWLELARATQQDLEVARSELQRAHGWSVFDAVGGGAISTVLKHGRFDRARMLLGQVQRQLQQLGTTRGSEVEADLSLGLRLADVVFDGLFVDLAVHRRLRDLIDLAGNWRSELVSALGTLLARWRELRTARREAETARTGWLVGVPAADAGG